MCKVLVSAVLGACACCAPLSASTLTGASVIIDKPDYSSTYSIGVQAYTRDGTTSVFASHDAPGAAPASWQLDQNNGMNSWWNWSPHRPAIVDGPLRGGFSISAQDAGGMDTLSAAIPGGLELDYAEQVSVIADGSGYRLAMSPVERADYYNIWVWSPTEGRYAWSLSNAMALQAWYFVGADALKPGLSYNVYFMANNQEQIGDRFNALFRSYRLIQLQVPVVAVPEPAQWAMLLGGFSALGTAIRRRKMKYEGA